MSTPSASPSTLRESPRANLRRIWRGLRGRGLGLVTDKRPVMEFHGGQRYGGWPVLAGQLGPESRVASIGIGEDASFDLSLIGHYGCRIVALDPTPRSGAWVAANVQDPRFIFQSRALAAHDGVLRLFLPKNPAHVSASSTQGEHVGDECIEAPCITLATLLRENAPSGLDLLKLDIEGAEYEVIRQALKDGSLARVRQLLVEFHHFFPAIGPDPTKSAVASLREAGWQLLWLSRNEREFVFFNPAAAAPA